MITLDECADILKEAPNCTAFLEAWLGWRGDRQIPPIENMRPEDLGKALPSLTVFEIQSSDHITYRLAGGLHEDLSERDLKGTNLLDLTPPEDRHVIIERARNIVAYPCGAVSYGRYVRQSGQETPMRILALPMKPRSQNENKKAYVALDSYGIEARLADDPVSTIPLPDEFHYVDLGNGAPE